MKPRFSKAGISGFKNLKPNELLIDLVSSIETALPNFVTSNTYRMVVGLKKNETQHNSAFCLYMNKGQDKFSFINESNQKGSHKVDLGVYLKATDELVFTIECKILPTPLQNNRVEHEYVYGKGAGIQRFKDGNHGLDNFNNMLPENGIIGYILEQDFNSWKIKINKWIGDALWPKNEFLKEDAQNSTAKYISYHKRSDNSEFMLHHFWVDISN